MIFGAGGISDLNTRSFSGNTKQGKITRTIAVSAVKPIDGMADKMFDKKNILSNNQFKELLEDNKNKLKRQEQSLLSSEQIKLAVMKQIMDRMLQMKEPQDYESLEAKGLLKMLWTREYVPSSFLEETSLVAFSSRGFAINDTGRVLSFGICMEMSETFCDYYHFFTREDEKNTQPIMVHVGENINAIADIRCLFDIDLKNHDEDEDIYHKLKVLMKDTNGYDIMVDLQSENANVVYNRNLKSNYSKYMNSSGIYSKESKLNKKNKANQYDVSIVDNIKNNNMDFSV